MTVNHLNEHPHAFLYTDGVVGNIATFAIESHNDEEIQKFAEATGFVKAICCCVYGLPYIGDTWDDTNKVWIENQEVRFPPKPEVTN